MLSLYVVVSLAMGLGIGFFIGSLWSRKAAFEKILEAEKRAASAETQRRDVEQVQAQLTQQFENLANKIFETKTHAFRESSEKNLQQLLNPLRDRIHEFQKKVEDAYHAESRERFALKEELNRIVEANQRMSSDAQQLTQALRGDVKAQGNWGEFVLQRILEASALREGEEYVLQGEGMSLKSEDGRSQRPDVIINLPEGKHLVVDSKVSLTHYERFCAEADPSRKQAALKLFGASLRAHVDGLAAKRYQDLEGVSAPDFVMMFVPIEGAFSIACQHEEKLFIDSWNKSIVIVSPTTLLATLRTVASIWKQERQTKNALEIARQGGMLYDKFVRFVETLGDLGDRLKGAQKSYDEALDHLKSGRGNLISRVENLQKLGAKTSKKMPDALLADDSTADPASRIADAP